MRFEAAAIYDQGLRDIDVAGSCGASVDVCKFAKDECENSGGEYFMSLAAVAQGAIHNIDAVASGIANADSSRFALSCSAMPSVKKKRSLRAQPKLEEQMR